MFFFYHLHWNCICKMCRQQTGDKLMAIANGFRTDPEHFCIEWTGFWKIVNALKLISKKTRFCTVVCIYTHREEGWWFWNELRKGGFISSTFIFSLCLHARHKQWVGGEQFTRVSLAFKWISSFNFLKIHLKIVHIERTNKYMYDVHVDKSKRETDIQRWI